MTHSPVAMVAITANREVLVPVRDGVDEEFRDEGPLLARLSRCTSAGVGALGTYR